MRPPRLTDVLEGDRSVQGEHSHFRRIPVRPGAEPYEAVAYCDDQGWTLLAKRETPDLLQYVFGTGQGQVHVTWNHPARKYVLTLIGEHAQTTEAHLRDLSASPFHPLELCTDEEALALATALAHPDDVFYAVLIADDRYDERVFNCVRQALASPDPDVRHAACTACASFVDWEQQIWPLLEHVRTHDADPVVRAAARLTLDVQDRHDWNRSERLISAGGH